MLKNIFRTFLRQHLASDGLRFKKFPTFSLDYETASQMWAWGVRAFFLAPHLIFGNLGHRKLINNAQRNQKIILISIIQRGWGTTKVGEKGLALVEKAASHLTPLHAPNQTPLK